MAIDPSAYLGTPEGYATKEQLAAAQMLSQLLMKPQEKTMYSPWQGGADVANALIGGYFGHLNDMRRIAKGQGEGAAGQIGIFGGNSAPPVAPSATSYAPNTSQDRVKTAALGGTDTDASTGGPPPFSSSIVKAISPNVGNTPPPTTMGTLSSTPAPGSYFTLNDDMSRSGASQPTSQSTIAAPSAPVQTAQAAGGAPVTSGGAMGQVGTFFDPQYLPKRLGITDQQMQKLEFLHAMGERSPEEMAQYRKLYMESKQPMSMDTRFGTLSWRPEDPNKQFLQPKIEEKQFEVGGIKGPVWVQQTPQGVVRIPMLSPQGAQGGGAVPSNGPVWGDFQSMSDWSAAQKAKEEAAKTSAQKDAEAYTKKYHTSQDNSHRSQQELSQLQLLQQVMNHPSYISGTGADTLGRLSSAARTMGWGEGRVATLQTLADKLGKAGALENIEELGQQGAVRVPTLNLIAKSNYDPHNTPEANRAVVEIRARTAQRQIEIGDLAAQYKKEHGQLDAGFDQLLTDTYRDKPLFTMDEIKNFNTLLDSKKSENAAPKRFKFNPATGQVE